jgi:glutathione synthase/RimK-type ligase-like ATP-grasp enzyme
MSGILDIFKKNKGEKEMVDKTTDPPTIDIPKEEIPPYIKTDLIPGDYVIVIDFDDLSDKQSNYLKSKDFFRVIDVVPKTTQDYVDVGYNIPLKSTRFKKIDNPLKNIKYKILFINFKCDINLMGEKDTKNFFRNKKNMENLFVTLFSEKIKDCYVNFTEYENIYKIGRSYFVDEIDIKEYDFVFFGFMSGYSSVCNLLIGYLNMNDVPYLKYGTLKDYDNKAYEFELIENIGYPYIPSVLTTRLSNDVLLSIKEFGYPLIIKDIHMNQGKGIKQINDINALKEYFRYSSRLKLIQKFIPNDGEYRVILIKNKVVLIAKKEQIDKVDTNTISNRKSKKGELPSHVIDMCENVSKYLFCDIVGIDIIRDVIEDKYYIMEMNSAPHLVMFSIVTDVNIPEIIVNHILQHIMK